MKLDLSVSGLDKVRTHIAALSGRQLDEAAAKALTDIAFQTRRAMQDEMRAVFDRPTPYVLSSVIVRPATPERLEAHILPTYGGAKGIDPQRILTAQAEGGPRRDKRSEAALRRIGVLPAGYQSAIPSEPYPGSDDGRGNLRGPFIVRLLSYLQAFGEQGYRANMTARRRAKLEARGVSESGYRTIAGVAFFVAIPGRDRTRHLAPGIWAKSGTHGAVLRPVLMFVRAGTYSRRLDMARVARTAVPPGRLEARLRFRIRQAAGV
jgi:hypothetical protein